MREHFPTTASDVKISGHQQGVKWDLIVVLIFIPLIASETEDLFKRLLAIQVSSENCPFIHSLKTFTPNKDQALESLV